MKTPARRRVRVAHVIDSLWVGGAQSVLLGTLGALDHDRFDSIVVNLGGGTPELFAQVEARAPVLEVSHRALWDVPALLRLRRLLHAQRVDVVHAHLTSSLVHGALAARLAGIPCVVTLHSIAEDRAHEGRLRRAFAELVTRKGIQRLIAVSESVRDSHVDQVGVDAAKLVLMPNIPFATLALPPAFDRDVKRTELGLDGVVVATASRLTAEREHDVLVEAIAALAERLPTVNALILAEGPQEPAIRTLVARRGLEGRVRFLGTRYDVAEVVSAADIFCQPTKHEGMPMAVLEAMSLGVPVVASAVAGVSDVVIAGETGLLVPPGDPRALADAIASLAEDPARARQLSEAGRGATANPSPAVWAGRIGMIYDELSGRKAAGDGMMMHP